MDDPVITRVDGGTRGEAVVLIPGYLTGASGVGAKWLPALRRRGFDGPVYEFHWDSSNKTELVRSAISRGLLGQGAGGLAGSAAFALAAVGGHWSTAKRRAKRSGIGFLMPMIEARVAEPRVTLVAHSLGARVAYYALTSEARDPRVDRLVMCGGAVRRDSSKDWGAVAGRCARGVHNVRNEEDAVLDWLFRTAELRQHPVGLRPIKECHPRLVDHDVTRDFARIGASDFMASHKRYADVLPAIWR